MKVNHNLVNCTQEISIWWATGLNKTVKWICNHNPHYWWWHTSCPQSHEPRFPILPQTCTPLISGPQLLIVHIKAFASCSFTIYHQRSLINGTYWGSLSEDLQFCRLQTIDCGELQIAELQSQDPCFTPELKNIMFKTRFIRSFSNEFSNYLCLLYSIQG